MKKLKRTNILTIPVIVDAIKGEGQEALVRCTYFSVECTRPSPGWVLDLNETVKVPFIMLGLQGLIHKPLGRAKLFSSPELINELFNLIDDTEAFFVDTNEVWFKVSDMPKASRGMVFRVSFELFTYGLRLASLSENEPIKTEVTGQASLSRAEHKAFSAWASLQVDDARENFKAMSGQGQALSRPDEEGRNG